MKILIICATILVILEVGANQSKAQLVVIADGISTSTGANWITNGLVTLGGAYVGVDWGSGGFYKDAAGSVDFSYASTGSQGTTAYTIQWPVGADNSIQTVGSATISNSITLGQAGGFDGKTGAALAGDVGSGNTLQISEVTTGAGTYTLAASFGTTYSVTATAANQVVYWDISGSSISSGQDLSFNSNSGSGGSDSVGAIGFSIASVPEPSTWIGLAIGLTLVFSLACSARGSSLLVFIRCR